MDEKQQHKILLWSDAVMTNDKPKTTATVGYPVDIENPDEWAAFLARYMDNRVTNNVHNGIGLVALHIVDAIREARANGK